MDNQRATHFLLGLIFALALMFVGLELTSRDNVDDIPNDIIDDLAQDIEMIPVSDQSEYIAAISAQKAPVVTSKIKAVDNVEEIIKKLDVGNNSLLVGDGEGITDEALITSAFPPIPIEMRTPGAERIVEQLPEFPGGMVEFMKWLTKNLKYPASMQRSRVQGKVVVSFIVNEDGSIADAKVEQPVAGALDREAMRVIRMMPRWKPGIQNNQPCKTKVAIPIVFKL